VLGRLRRRTSARPGVALATLVLAAAVVTACGEKEENLDVGTTATTGEPAAAIAGRWTGQLAQKGLPPFQIAVVINAGGSGAVAYTGINCGGTWTPRFTAPPAAGAPYIFDERIDRGAGGSCKGTGSVSVTHEGNTLSYRFTGGSVSSDGALSLASADQIVAVFKQAGLGGGRATVRDQLPPG
jgi:hypothetical protein